MRQPRSKAVGPLTIQGSWAALLRFGQALVLIAVVCVVPVGCASLPLHVQKHRSEALKNPGETSLGRLAAGADEGRGLSGIRLLASGDEALASLLALADRAERTLDLQYYIIAQDESARMVLQHVRKAAERGVRVRILVDDFNTAGEDPRLMRLGQHANIEVRLFNPFPGGRFALWTRFLASASDIPRINHRMHNKLFVADNALAITGGRNIGDQYFTLDKYSNFIDLDVVAAGPIVPQLSASFDAFWNSKYAYPIASIAAPVPRESDPQWLDELPSSGDADFLARGIDAGRLELSWVPATVLADRPVKIGMEGAPELVDTIASDVDSLIRSAKQEVLIMSPYLVPGDDGIALMRGLIRDNVRIRILTNSLASTDAPLVHIGYSRYRVRLLQLGVDLREMRPLLGTRRARFHPFRSAAASLHAKAIVIDQKTVFIGSLNMDARSARQNSELGIVIRSSDIARQVASLIDDVSDDGSYKLQLFDHTDQIEWLSGAPGAEEVWFQDPHTTTFERIALDLLAPFAPDELL
jgi:phosphatidylserine/phosphatidylglycerophosphate/cardiolipin synthase-like enzyme